MFNFFKKNKKINTDNVRGFNRVLSTIKSFIFIEEWENAYNAIKEIKAKEKLAYEELMKKITDSNKIDLIEKEKQTNIYKKRIIELDKLEVLTKNNEEKFNTKVENKKFKIRFEQIRGEIQKLSKTNKNSEALNLLTNFLEEHKDKDKVIAFFNKEKKIILKWIEKQRKQEAEKIKHNVRLEAMKLMWETLKFEEDPKNEKEKKIDKEKTNFIKKIIKKFTFYKHIKDKLKRKHMLDDINLLIDENSKTKQDIASKKLENIHKWLIKEISNEKILGYDLYWKILWADKISWDAFWFNETKDKYTFFIWDATGHWIRAWFIITLLTKLFNDLAKKKTIKELCLEINNWLKQNLKSRNFITWIFFEIIKKEIWKINFVWMWHEPMLIYKVKEQKVNQIIPWWLAAWIRIIKDIEQIKSNEIILEEWDILITYSDWIVEAKNTDWNFYWIDKLKDTVKKICTVEKDTTKIYEYIINDLSLFKWWTSFEDDATLFLVKRNTKKDIQEENSNYLKEITLSQWLNRKQSKILIWKTKNEIEIELDKIKKEKELKSIIKSLDTLYYTWEVLKLKQEAIRFIKKWYIDKKINRYLRLAIANETKYKVNKKRQKILSKYNVLTELYKKWDFNTVIEEAENVIAKDWNI